jgi:predicted PurR-regulated permease PerM
MGDMDDNRPRWSTQAKLAIVFLLLLLGVYLLYRFRSALTPLVLAVVLAFILSPAVNLIQERLRIRRGPATLLAYLVLLLGAGGILMVIIPLLANQVSGLNLDIQLFVRSINKFLGRRIYIAGQPFDLEAIFQQVVGAMQPVYGRTLGFAVGVVTSVVWVIFIIVIAFYLIKDYQALRNWLENLVPPQYRADYVRLRGEIHIIWSAFFRGQLMLALVVASLFTVIGAVLGLPFSLAMGIFAGLLEFLPSVGHGIWLVTASLLALFVGSSWIPVANWVFMLVVIGLHLFYQQFDLNYLIPRIIGRSVHLPPLVVILGIVSGAILTGVLGIVLAAPTIASARVVGRYIYANLFDLEPFPALPDTALPPPNPRWWRKYFPSK